MRQVLLYSVLLMSGLLISQFLGESGAFTIKMLTMFTLAYIMIHVGYEFEIDKSRPGQYAWDYVVAATAAGFPWLFCALYFVFVMGPAELWFHGDMWKEALLEGRFASPTSAGVLFSMLTAAGLAATWVFNKARILAIFDDLDTILLMLPLTFMMVGFRWQLMAVVAVMLFLLWLAWQYLDAVRLPITWPYVLGYAALLTFASEAVYQGSKGIDPAAPVHLEVLLPAFVWGCILAPPKMASRNGEAESRPREEVFERRGEKRVSLIVTASFMVLVGLSMPPLRPYAAPSAVSAEGNADEVAIGAKRTGHDRQMPEQLQYEGVPADVLAAKQAFPGWDIIALHVLVITLLSNLGKMFPLFCYRREASLRERLAVTLCMFPRGEVGAGVLVVSLSYGLSGPAITVAVLSLVLNLLCTGAFIVAVRKLTASAKQTAVPPRRRGRYRLRKVAT